jgi:hypothetical protein
LDGAPVLTPLATETYKGCGSTLRLRYYQLEAGLAAVCWRLLAELRDLWAAWSRIPPIPLRGIWCGITPITDAAPYCLTCIATLFADGRTVSSGACPPRLVYLRTFFVFSLSRARNAALTHTLYTLLPAA